MEESLKKKTVSGMFWTAIQKFGVTGMSFCTNIILARLLTPEDFGIIGMLAIFVAVSATFIDGGFGSALIQKKNPTQVDYSTILYLNTVISVILYAILYFSAPYIAEFYQMDILCDVLRVMGITLIINALSYVQAVKLRKDMKFKKLSYVYLSASLTSFIVSIFMAYSGFGVWSLVWMNIINCAIASLLLWIVGDWFPSYIFSKEASKTLFGFGSFLLLSNLINTFCNNIQGLIIGKLFNASDMGYYSQAKKLNDIPATSISSIIDNVSYPVMAANQDNMKEFVSVVSKFIRIIATISFPIMTLLIILGRPLIIFLYSDKWENAVPYFQILCIGGLAICLQNINYNAVAALGKSRDLFKWTLIKRGLSLIFIIIGSILGLYYLLWGVVIGSWIIYFCNSYVLGKYSKYSVSSQWKDLSRVIFITILAVIPCLICVLLLKSSTLSYLVQGITFLVAFITLTRFMMKETFFSILQMVLKRNSN
jgi:O-antigen/teichoic acid export membrane protein